MIRLGVLALVVVGVLVVSWILRSVEASPMGRAAEEDVPLGKLLVFTSPGCRACAAQRRILDLLTESERRHIELVDVTQHADLVERLTIRTLPTHVVARGDGTVVRSLGVQRVERVRNLISKATAHAG